MLPQGEVPFLSGLQTGMTEGLTLLGDHVPQMHD